MEKSSGPSLDRICGRVTLQKGGGGHRERKFMVIFCKPPQYFRTNSNEDKLSVSPKGRKGFVQVLMQHLESCQGFE